MLDAEGFAATRLVTHLLERLQVPYVIGGSVASTAHGVIRSTLTINDHQATTRQPVGAPTNH